MWNPRFRNIMFSVAWGSFRKNGKGNFYIFLNDSSDYFLICCSAKPLLATGASRTSMVIRMLQPKTYSIKKLMRGFSQNN